MTEFQVRRLQVPGVRYTMNADLQRYQKCRRYVEQVMQEAIIQVRQRGALTLPAEIRKKYGIEAGDTYRMVDLDGIFILTPMAPMVPELAREIERLRLDAGLGIEELLEGLQEQREQYYVERYAGKVQAGPDDVLEQDDIESDARSTAD
jgi:bifunctional DNA-binding transcriptional regulator/antitoxin component of YhaV-PrlF toxin-antitoxin module